MFIVQYYKEVLRGPWDSGQRRRAFKTMAEVTDFTQRLSQDGAEYIKILKPKQPYD